MRANNFLSIDSFSMGCIIPVPESPAAKCGCSRAAPPPSLAYRRGRVHHQINGLRRLGEGNPLAQAFGARQDHHDAVEAQRNSAVRRRAVLQRLQEEAEARLLLLGRHAEGFEDLRLNVLAMNTNG